MTTHSSQQPSPQLPPPVSPCLLQAVKLLRHATCSEPKLDVHWFALWRGWLEGIRTQQYTTGAMRLRHALALFAVQAIEDQGQPCGQDAVVCIALYLASLCQLDAAELCAPMWQDNDDIDAAYALVPPEENQSTQSSPWISGAADQSISSFPVMDVISGVIHTINFKVQPNTPYRHCTPLLMGLLNNKEWDPCEVIAHLRSMRSTQFELLNMDTQNLPGESQTLHGMLAMHLFSYMHSTAWKPAPSPHLAVLDEVVWDTLCLTNFGNQAGDWLDTLNNRLPNAGLAALRIPKAGEPSIDAEGLSPLTTICTPAFPSLHVYAAVASQSMGKRDSRAHWFERRYHRLAHAMRTLLLVLPSGARQAGDWDALNAWWRLDVQGLVPSPLDAPDTAAQSMDLPEGFE